MQIVPSFPIGYSRRLVRVGHRHPRPLQLRRPALGRDNVAPCLQRVEVAAKDLPQPVLGELQDVADFQQDEQDLDGGRVVQVGSIGAGDDLQLLCLFLAEMVGLLEPSVLALGLVGEAAGQAPLYPVGRVLWCDSSSCLSKWLFQVTGVLRPLEPV